MREILVIGIDVGGPRKGFHAVALDSAGVRTIFACRGPASVAQWCRRLGARAVAVDSPCGWSCSGGSRAAERELRQEGINCFSTPKRIVARKHGRRFYDWMLNGEKLYLALRRESDKVSAKIKWRPQIVETFPHAVAWALAGGRHPGLPKRRVRRQLLERAGIETGELQGIDYLDAALCALAARSVLERRSRSYGGAEEGEIVVPISVARRAVRVSGR